MKVKLVQEFPVHGSLSPGYYETKMAKEIANKFKKGTWARWAGRIIEVGKPLVPKHWTCDTFYIWPSLDKELNKECGGAINLCSHMFEVVEG
jgi:hypothetical protein